MTQREPGRSRQSPLPICPESVAWAPQAGPQAAGISLREAVDELFFGGSRGPGKTDFLIGDFATDLWQGSNWQGVLFRRSFPELEEVIKRTLEIYPRIGGYYKVGTHTWTWKSGATLKLRHIDTIFDVTAYQGHSYSWIGWDELPLWEDLESYHRLKATLRGKAKNKRIRATGNPGGPGHLAVKEYFQIGEYPRGGVPYQDPDTDMVRMFLRGRLTDNQELLKVDPGYVNRLKGTGDPELVAAWLDGDWDAVVGSYFSMLRKSEVEVEPFEIPQGWAPFLCMDYGEHNPTVALLLAVNFDDDVYVIDEYYRGGEGGGADHARGIKDMVDHCPFIIGKRPSLALAPHDMWTKRRPGEASQAQSPSDSFAKEGIYLTRANMERINGWRNLKDLLYSKRIKFFKGRTDKVLGSLSSVVRDQTNPEDVMKGGDDHPADALRYGINHVYRPRVKKPEPVSAPYLGSSIIASLKEEKSRYG